MRIAVQCHGLTPARDVINTLGVLKEGHRELDDGQILARVQRRRQVLLQIVEHAAHLAHGERVLGDVHTGQLAMEVTVLSAVRESADVDGGEHREGGHRCAEGARVAEGSVGHHLRLGIEGELAVEHLLAVDVDNRAQAGHDQRDVLPQLLHLVVSARLVQSVVELPHGAAVVAEMEADHSPGLVQGAAVVADQVHHGVGIGRAHEVRGRGRVLRVLIHDLVVVPRARVLCDPHGQRERAVRRVVEALHGQHIVP